MSKTMIVTGGGRGIGAAIARLAGTQGYDVAVNYSQSEDHARKVVADIEKAGRRAIAVQGDMGSEDDILRMFETVDKELGPVSAMVNNAAIDYETSIADMELSKARRLFDINVFGLLVIARECFKRMATDHGGAGGAILNIGSISARYGGLPGDVVYASSKGAVDSMTMGLAHEFGRSGIRVNCLRPGLILTDIWERSVGVEVAKELGKTGSMLRRIGEPEEIAPLALWLCSDEASYVTAAIYDVDGGRGKVPSPSR